MALDILYLGGAAVAAFLAWQKGYFGHGNTAGSTIPAGPGSQPNPNANGPADVAGDVRDDETDWLTEDVNTQELQWRNQFYRQMWLPASKVLPSQLDPQTWRYTIALLSGKLHRYNDASHAWQIITQAYGSSKEAAGGGQAVATAVGAILSLINPILGKVWDAGVGSQIDLAIAQADIAFQSAGKVGGVISKNLGELFKDSLRPENLDPPVRMMLASSSHGGESKMDPNLVPWFAQSGIYLEDRWVAPPWNSDNYAGVYYYPHARFFTQFSSGGQHGGWILPWLSFELGYGGNEQYGLGGMKTLRQRINMRARIYKALEMISNMADPDTEALKSPLQFPNKYRYYYMNPVLGPIAGSIFPPTVEDKRIKTADGRWLHWDGTEWKDPATQAITVGGLHGVAAGGSLESGTDTPFGPGAGAGETFGVDPVAAAKNRAAAAVTVVDPNSVAPRPNGQIFVPPTRSYMDN